MGVERSVPVLVLQRPIYCPWGRALDGLLLRGVKQLSIHSLPHWGGADAEACCRINEFLEQNGWPEQAA
eukprot:NODE_11855_length_272_cov_3.382488.p5 GENE.NODE_11855_length_272_cov_3.382488~~NODE_11855_length_272_cov_3.382488.p5  ORF type:complete len:69 (-),score=19.22 NODE_11855_length_272_cov_3.382488:50-256(-)